MSSLVVFRMDTDGGEMRKRIGHRPPRGDSSLRFRWVEFLRISLPRRDAYLLLSSLNCYLW